VKQWEWHQRSRDTPFNDNEKNESGDADQAAEISAGVGSNSCSRIQSRRRSLLLAPMSQGRHRPNQGCRRVNQCGFRARCSPEHRDRCGIVRCCARALRDSKGASLAAPDLPFFNPFPAGNQLARYATELFGNITVAAGTLTVESSGPDGFLPLALFDNHGVFSTTATIRRYLVDPIQLTGKYAGSWKTSSSTGAISQTLSVDTSTKTITLSLSAAGDPAAPETMTCKYVQEGCIASFSSMLSGPGTVVVQPDGTLYIRARPMGFGFFNLDGYLSSGSMWGAWTIGLASIRTTGVWTMAK
jgi:hypothetical protein